MKLRKYAPHDFFSGFAFSGFGLLAGFAISVATSPVGGFRWRLCLDLVIAWLLFVCLLWFLFMGPRRPNV